MLTYRSIIYGIKKIIILPIKYRKKDDYNAEKYWKDRFQKYKTSYKGVGLESISDRENREIYHHAGLQFKEILLNLKINFTKIKTLEIGPGIGFYTDIMYSQLGIHYLTAIDITDYYFKDLKNKYPSYNFIKQDISKEKIMGEYDLILIIDVIEHIVLEEKFIYTMYNIKTSLRYNGYLILSGYSNNSNRKNLFHFKHWKKDKIINELTGFTILNEIKFRNNNLIILQKKYFDKSNS